MATLVTLTDYWSVHRGNKIPREVVVNLDMAKTIERLPSLRENSMSPGMAERTQIWFGGYDDDDESLSAEHVLVTETLDEILEAAREVARG